MVTSPLLSNVHHRAMITPINLLLTRLIHISPSCWTIYCSSEVILDMGTYLGLDLKSNIQLYNYIQIHCFKAHSVRYELCFKKYST